MVGPALALSHDFVDSALYDPSIPHVLRPVVGVDLIEDHNT
jgi:precorrin-4/cobalt-precorrin-4 C11-methyltransferase